jgi:hypothetical protein
MATYGTFQVPQQLRDFARFSPGNPVSPGGWHYSFMGGPENVRKKVENIAESSLIIDKVGDVNEIAKKMENVQDLWGRTEELAQKTLIDLKVDNYKPKSMDKFLQLYPEFYNNNV